MTTGLNTFSGDPYLTYVVTTEHERRLRRAADERRLRLLRRRPDSRRPS